MIERRLKFLILAYLWVALVEDTLLFLMAWVAPDIWFRLFHIAAPAGLEVALLRRSAGQWGRVRTVTCPYALALANRARLACRECWRALFRLVHRCVVHRCRPIGDYARLDLAAAASFP
jgi:hypothetical protein